MSIAKRMRICKSSCAISFCSAALQSTKTALNFHSGRADMMMFLYLIELCFIISYISLTSWSSEVQTRLHSSAAKPQLFLGFSKDCGLLQRQEEGLYQKVMLRKHHLCLIYVEGFALFLQPFPFYDA